MAIVITGAGGQLGRQTVQELSRRVNAADIVALSRDPGKIADLGVRTAVGDFARPDTLVRAFDGADRVLIISTGAVGRRLQQHKNAIDAAVKAGVGRVFYTSAPRATDDGHPAYVVPDHRGTEEALAHSGLRYTALRNSIYTDMLLLALPQAIASGAYATNGGSGGTSYLPRADLAAATAAILADPRDPGTVLELTGQAAVTDAEIAAITAEIVGRSIAYQELTDEQLVAASIQAGLDAATADGIASLGRATREGYLCIVTDVVEQYLGRKPTSVADFLTGRLGG